MIPALGIDVGCVQGSDFGCGNDNGFACDLGNDYGHDGGFRGGNGSDNACVSVPDRVHGVVNDRALDNACVADTGGDHVGGTGHGFDNDFADDNDNGHQ